MQALAPIPEAESESPPDSPTREASSQSVDSIMRLPSLNEAEDVIKHGWDAIPKPKGHSGVDYSRWGNLGDDLSDSDEEDEEPQYRYRLSKVGLSNFSH